MVIALRELGMFFAIFRSDFLRADMRHLISVMFTGRGSVMAETDIYYASRVSAGRRAPSGSFTPSVAMLSYAFIYSLIVEAMRIPLLIHSMSFDLPSWKIE